MALSPIAAHIWDRSEEYVKYALQHLVFPSPQQDKSSPICFCGSAERARLLFLFPGIAEKGHAALMEIREKRWRFGCVLRGDRVDPTASSALSVEQVEATFEEAKAPIATILSSFSPVQQEILAEKFFRAD